MQLDGQALVLAFKVIFERPGQVLDSNLQRNGIRLFQPRVLLFESGQLVLHLEASRKSLGCGILRFAHGEKMVIDIAGSI